MDSQTFIQSFNEFAKENNLFDQADKILLALSGGVDSVVLCDLMHKGGIDFSIAHLNFQLRGKDSDLDEELVKEISKKYQKKLFIRKVETRQFAQENGVSIEMAAREIRYKWFEELRIQDNLSLIATAHHLNDQTETILLNLTKGTGLRGLHGIKPKLGKLIRPLMFASRNEIEEFAKNEHISYRIDLSNEDNCFQRNRIRNKVIPELLKINPALQKSMEQNAVIFGEYESYVNHQIGIVREKVFEKRNDLIFFDYSIIQNDPFFELLFFELVRPYGFSMIQAREIISSLNSQPGKLFLTCSHTILLDRKSIIIKENEVSLITGEILVFDKNSIVESPNGEIIFNDVQYDNVRDLKNPGYAFLDMNKLQFPLLIRKWKEGDRFTPYGMKSVKKVSDVLTDLKINHFNKEKVLVLVSKGEIVWLIGIRISELYKITPETKNVLQVFYSSDKL